ncbi:MAG TPA: hypothetical protein PLV68_01740 [Ilumatobacteraceae bacterium]|nr:hypothetical protein [Ilumatobacteraceae bacterium]
MSATAATLAIASPRAGGVAVGAAGVAAAGWVASGMLTAIPAGIGLAAVAATDLSTHHFSLRTLGWASSFVVAALIADSIVLVSWDRLGVALVGSAAVAIVLVVGWLGTAGLAFGDVLLVPFAIALPLYLSALGAAVTVGVALVAAALSAVLQAVRVGVNRSRAVPLAPPLLLGWITGVMVG